MKHSTFNTQHSTAQVKQPMPEVRVESSGLKVECSPTAPETFTLRALAHEPEEDKLSRRLIWACAVCVLFGAAALFGLFSRTEGKVPRAEPQATALVPVAFIAQTPSSAEGSAPDSKPATSKTSAASPAPQVEPAVIPLNPNRAPASVTPLRPAPENPLPAQRSLALSQPVTSRFEPTQNSAFTPQPAYPSLAQRRGQQGSVRIEFTVEPGGRVTDVRMSRSSGFVLLDEAALAVVRDQWEFPAGPERHHFVDIVFQLK